mmetsp:Transcript_19309/g.51915  ORF Transcript_19309/g.51915 Transcript_19309/m.51915 type:complete len:227 (-) Transcript_19309:200-880(-)
MTPTRGASPGMSVRGRWTPLYHSLYSPMVWKISGASGCQMPCSGSTTGSISFSSSMKPGRTLWTYPADTRNSIASRFSLVPPSQCCRDTMNVRASFAWSPGRNFSTLGSVLTSFRRLSWKAPPEGDGLPFWRLFWRRSFTCCAKPPSGPPVMAVRSNVPSLLSFITSGMDGKHRHASRRSRCGCTISTSFSASSCTKMSEHTKTLALSRSFCSSSCTLGSRISSRR